MANEASVQCSLQIRAGNIVYRGQPTAFKADVTGRKGPLPGTFEATTEGTDLDLSQLVSPSLYRIMNLDEDNYVTLGIYDAANALFHPLHDLLPGETYVGRFSRHLGIEFAGTGTGTSGVLNTVRIKANTASCNVLVEAFEL